MKVVVDADTEQILGAAILGVGGDEVVHAILDHHDRQGALHRDIPHDAHPSDGQ